MGAKSGSKIHLKLSPRMLEELRRLHPRLVASRGVSSFSDVIRMALARGIRQLSAEVDAESTTPPTG